MRGAEDLCKSCANYSAPGASSSAGLLRICTENHVVRFLDAGFRGTLNLLVLGSTPSGLTSFSVRIPIQPSIAAQFGFYRAGELESARSCTTVPTPAY